MAEKNIEFCQDQARPCAELHSSACLRAASDPILGTGRKTRRAMRFAQPEPQ